MTKLDRRQVVGGLAALGALLGPLRAAFAAGKVAINEKSVLIVVDVQNCFLPGGSLAVKDGEQVIPVINSLAKALCQCGADAGLAYAGPHLLRLLAWRQKAVRGDQAALWRPGAMARSLRAGNAGRGDFAGISIPQAELVLRKGYHKTIDSYSAFFEADHKTPTGLAGYLKQRGLSKVFVTGLATDFCVGWTAIDARRSGFETYVVEDACRGIDVQGSLAKAWAAMAKAGVKRIMSGDIAA